MVEYSLTLYGEYDCTADEIPVCLFKLEGGFNVSDGKSYSEEKYYAMDEEGKWVEHGLHEEFRIKPIKVSRSSLEGLASSVLLPHSVERENPVDTEFCKKREEVLLDIIKGLNQSISKLVSVVDGTTRKVSEKLS